MKMLLVYAISNLILYNIGNFHCNKKKYINYYKSNKKVVYNIFEVIMWINIYLIN